MNYSSKELITNDMLPFKYDNARRSVKSNKPILNKQYMYTASTAGGLYILSDIHKHSSNIDKSKSVPEDMNDSYKMNNTKGGFVRNIIFPLGLTSAATALGLFTVNEIGKDYNIKKRSSKVKSNEKTSKSKLKSKSKK